LTTLALMLMLSSMSGTSMRANSAANKGESELGIRKGSG
jgi:hypothetical protein